MQKRRIGKTNIEVSLLGLGTVKIGRNQGVKYPTAFALPSDYEVNHLLETAASLGINLLDTAPAYGMSEERLGKILQGKRHNWIISTKVGEEFNDGLSNFDFSKQALRLSIERSLKRLQTDYLDIVLIHSHGEDIKIIEQEDIFSLLAAYKKEGKIRAYGMSTKTIAGGMLTVDRADLVMVTYNLNYQDERQIISYAHKKQKGILIKKALASGHLVGIEQALQFILKEPGVSSVIIGTLNSEHLRENVRAASYLS